LFGKNKRKQFEKLFQPHLNACYNLARYLCGNAHDAEDIVQEAYLRAYRAFDGFTDDNRRAWILTVTRNTCHSWMRRNLNNQCVPFDEELNGLDVDTQCSVSIPSRSPEQIAESNNSQQIIIEAIESLPIEFREVAILRELEELSYHDIGLVLGIPKGTVMSRIARARLRLRKLLAIGIDQE